MKSLPFVRLIIVLAFVLLGSASAFPDVNLGDNAALQYWAAFAQMQDSEISGQEAKQLNAIVDGTGAYDDLKYKDLVVKNRQALETMARGTTLTECDWGLDYKLGEDVPVDYARKSLTLGRLNALYALHLLASGDKDQAVRSLVAGLRFSRDVQNGGSLFAAVVAKDILVNHLNALSFAVRQEQLSAAQRGQLQRAIGRLGPNAVDWQSAVKRELENLRGQFSRDQEAWAALAQIIPAYVGALDNPAGLPTLTRAINGAPHRLKDLIPNPQRVLDEKQDLINKLAQTRLLFQ